HEKQEREGESDVDDPHQRLVDRRPARARGHSGDHPERRAEGERQRGRAHGDREREPGAVHQPCEEVAVERIGSERVRGGGRRWAARGPARQGEVARVGLAHQPGADERQQNEEQHDGEAEEGGSVASKPLTGALHQRLPSKNSRTTVTKSPGRSSCGAWPASKSSRRASGTSRLSFSAKAAGWIRSSRPHSTRVGCRIRVTRAITGRVSRSDLRNAYALSPADGGLQWA